MKNNRGELRKRLREAKPVHTPATELIDKLRKAAREAPVPDKKKDTWY